MEWEQTAIDPDITDWDPSQP